MFLSFKIQSIEVVLKFMSVVMGRFDVLKKTQGRIESPNLQYQYVLVIERYALDSISFSAERAFNMLYSGCSKLFSL